MPASRELKVTSVAFAKNEGPFLLEWIAYHKLIGVSDFLIYTNDCEDDSPALLDRLTEMGIVTHVPNPILPGEKPQLKALATAATHPLVTSADYVLQTDIDEFLCIKTGSGRIPDLVSTAPEADAFCIQMKFFGDSGLVHVQDGLIIDSFVMSSDENFALGNIIKTLAKNTKAFTRITGGHTPFFSYNGGASPRFFNCGGTEIPSASYSGQRFRTIGDQFRSMKYAQLNHYAVKTFEWYRAKAYRGDAINDTGRLSLKFWNERNRNDARDTAIQTHIAGTKAIMNDWLRDPVLNSSNRRCMEAYEHIVDKARNIFDAPSEASR